MSARLGGSQISSLLESVPGIASVLRSPVADAIVSMVRSGAGLAPFEKGMAKELVQYAVRRGLLPVAEGDDLLAEVAEAVEKDGRAKPKKAEKKPAKVKTVKKAASAASKKAIKKAAKVAKRAPVKASTKKTAKKKAAKRTSKPAKKSSRKR